MRIISKFRDYYDGVMKSGMDQNIVYVRENKEIVLDQDYGIKFSTKEVNTKYTVELVLLGYCGKIFKIYVLTEGDVRHVFHDRQDFQDFMLRNGFGSKYDFEVNRWWPGRYSRFADFDTSKLLELFHKYQTPLFTISNKYYWRSSDETKVILGPSLKDLNFYELKDTYTAYQDIFQYVSGVLNQPETKMVKITDKDKIHKHGFDNWSFRKLPGSKKRHK